MGDGPTTTNNTANTVNNVISVASDVVVATVEALIITEVPFLGMPVIKQIFDGVFHFIAGYFVRAAQMGATFAVIDIQTAVEENALTKALAEIQAAEKSGDKDALQKALQDYQKAQSALINSDGSSTNIHS